MIILHERAVILLTRSEVLNIATRATVSDKNMKCKQSENRVNKGENHTKAGAHQSYFQYTKAQRNDGNFGI